MFSNDECHSLICLLRSAQTLPGWIFTLLSRLVLSWPASRSYLQQILWSWGGRILTLHWQLSYSRLNGTTGLLANGVFAYSPRLVLMVITTTVLGWANLNLALKAQLLKVKLYNGSYGQWCLRLFSTFSTHGHHYNKSYGPGGERANLNLALTASTQGQTYTRP